MASQSDQASTNYGQRYFFVKGTSSVQVWCARRHSAFSSSTVAEKFSGSLPFVTLLNHWVTQQVLLPRPPSTVRALTFIARSVQYFLTSSTRVESCIHTLLGAIC